MNLSFAGHTVRGFRALLQNSSEMCGSPACSVQAPLWRASRSRGLIANRAWFCSSSCLEKRILSECANRAVAHLPVTRMPLGMILLAQGAITEADLRYVLTAQQQT